MLLYYITDRTGFPGTEAQRQDALLRRMAEASRAGVDYIQLREKDLPARELERLARDSMHAVREGSADVKVLVNSRTDIALATGADGVHLPAGKLSPSEVRALWMKSGDPLVGVSAHTIAEVLRAEQEAATFVVLAPIFSKVQGNVPGIGIDVLRLACGQARTSHRPGFAVLALGGVNLSNAAACLAAGADGIAGIRLFQTGDVFDTVRQLKAI